MNLLTRKIPNYVGPVVFAAYLIVPAVIFFHHWVTNS